MTDTLLVFVGLVLLASLLSTIYAGISAIVARIRYRMEREEREMYEARFARLAEEAAAGPLLLADQRVETKVVRFPTDPSSLYARVA